MEETPEDNQISIESHKNSGMKDFGINMKVIRPSQLKPPLGSFILLLSTRKSGKSYVVAELTHYYLTHHVKYMYMFSNTARFEANGIYGFIDPKVIFKADPENCERIVSSIFQLQLETGKKNNVLLVFDDIDLSARYHGSIEKLATEGRHYNITTIVSAQVSTGAISPAIRDNITYLFIREMNREHLRKNIYSLITSREFENGKEFLNFVYNNTDNFHFIAYSKGCVKKEFRIVLAKDPPTPPDFKYKVKAPKAEQTNKSYVAGYGYGAPIDITYFDSEGIPLRSARTGKLEPF